MILPKVTDVIHKAIMYRLISHILDDKTLSQYVYFKGGTCAAILGVLDRFSVDLDFDLKNGSDKHLIRQAMTRIFDDLGLVIKQEAKAELFFVVKYESPKQQRNTLKVSIVDHPPKANIYQTMYLSDIDRYAQCQSKETMFANKLVAVLDRFEKHKSIAGRDIYDIHHFFTQGFSYTKEVIVERRHISVNKYLQELVFFIDKHVSQPILIQDLNFLLPPAKYRQIIPTLKTEVLLFLNDEIKRAT